MRTRPPLPPSDVRPFGVAPVFLFPPPPPFFFLSWFRAGTRVTSGVTVRYSDAAIDAIAASAD